MTEGKKALNHLNKMRDVWLPGNFLLCFVIPIQALILLLSLPILPFMLVKFADNAISTTAITVGLIIWPTLFVMQISLIVWVCIWSGRMNDAFIKRNTICLNYPLSNAAMERFQLFMRSFDVLSQLSPFQLVPIEDGYEYISAYFKASSTLPRYLSSNIDTRCLNIDRNMYYLLPDCVLVYCRGEYLVLQWDKVFLNNNVSGNFRKIEYREVMTWGRIRQDGGLDQRYNTQYGQEPYWDWNSLASYDPFWIKFGNNTHIIVATRVTGCERLSTTIRCSLNDWCGRESYEKLIFTFDKVNRCPQCPKCKAKWDSMACPKCRTKQTPYQKYCSLCSSEFIHECWNCKTQFSYDKKTLKGAI
jgi:hypothetical protein